MNNSRRCIFHIPNYIDINRKSASNIRPTKMIRAFEDNGYIVDVVMGYVKDRKKQIRRIKENIKRGVKYDFLYSESSTMPTLLTEKHHLPTHPFLDYQFIKYCKRKKIKVGLFYRDMHWKFNQYKENVVLWKRIFSNVFYKYDLYKYRKLLDYLYLPSNGMIKYLPYKNIKTKKYKIDILPPGCDIKEILEKKQNKKLKIFYVGGLTEEVYNFEELFKAVQHQQDIKMTVCCRENDWDIMKVKYNQYLNENINIVHAGTKELEEYYKDADVCSLLFKKNDYMQFAMPVKMFEYLSYNKPIIATKNTEAGEFVEKNKIGWTIEYKYDEIKNMLNYLKNNTDEIQKIKNNQIKVIRENTWYERARKVINQLF